MRQPARRHFPIVEMHRVMAGQDLVERSFESFELIGGDAIPQQHATLAAKSGTDLVDRGVAEIQLGHRVTRLRRFAKRIKARQVSAPPDAVGKPGRASSASAANSDLRKTR